MPWKPPDPPGTAGGRRVLSFVLTCPPLAQTRPWGRPPGGFFLLPKRRRGIRAWHEKKTGFRDGRNYRPASYEEDRTRRNKKTQPAPLANWRARSPFCCVPTAWQQFRIVGTSALLSAQGSMTKLNDKAQSWRMLVGRAVMPQGESSSGIRVANDGQVMNHMRLVTKTCPRVG